MFPKVDSTLKLYKKELLGESFISTATSLSSSINWHNFQLNL